eukprot:gene9292-12520_t
MNLLRGRTSSTPVPPQTIQENNTGDINATISGSKSSDSSTSDIGLVLSVKKAGKSWQKNVVKVKNNKLNALSREELIVKLTQDDSVDATNLQHMVDLSVLLMNSHIGTTKDIESLYVGAVLAEFAILKGYSINFKQMILLAKSHHEIWYRRGVAAEEYHLLRARALFEKYFSGVDPSVVNSGMHLDYCRVLMFLGDHEAAAIEILYIINTYENDPDIASFYFYAGAIYKALNQYDQASNYFFEATQMGPPKHFSKIEMMIIISRNLEKMGSDANAEDSNEEAYKMVYDHLVLEGHISSDFEYEDWISDSKTWMALGDKCAIHQLFSLATDFYSLCIMNDPDAFRKPKLWYRFAKACYRCGRTADAQLSIQQALTRDPYNLQIVRAKKYWSEDHHDFENLLKGSLLNIINHIPHPLDMEKHRFFRLQSIARGIVERSNLKHGVGRRKDIIERMFAKIGILLHGVHPVLISIRSSWMGCVSYIYGFDVHNNSLGKIKLKTPFAPAMESGQPRRLKLTMECLNSSFVSPQEKQFNRLINVFAISRTASRRLSNSLINSPKVMSGTDTPIESSNSNSNDAVSFEDIANIVFKFTDLDTGVYFARKSTLTFSNNRKNPSVLNMTDITDNNEVTHQRNKEFECNVSQSSFYDNHTLTAENINNHSKSKDSDYFSYHDEPIPPPIDMIKHFDSFVNGAINSYFSDYVKVQDDEQVPITITNVMQQEILKCAFTWKSELYFLRILNEHDVTQLSIFQSRSDLQFVFLVLREYIDRAQNVRKMWTLLMQFIESNPLIANVLTGEPIDIEKINSPENNPSYILGKHCYISVKESAKLITVILVDPNSTPMFGNGFEMLQEESATVYHSDNYDKKPVSQTTASIRNEIIDDFLKGNVNIKPSLSPTIPEFKQQLENINEVDEGQVTATGAVATARAVSFDMDNVTTHEFERMEEVVEDSLVNPMDESKSIVEENIELPIIAEPVIRDVEVVIKVEDSREESVVDALVPEHAEEIVPPSEIISAVPVVVEIIVEKEDSNPVFDDTVQVEDSKIEDMSIASDNIVVISNVNDDDSMLIMSETKPEVEINEIVSPQEDEKNVEVEEDPPAVVPFDEVIPSEEPLIFQGEDQIVVDDTIILSSNPIDEEDSPVQVTIPNEEIIELVLVSDATANEEGKVLPVDEDVMVMASPEEDAIDILSVDASYAASSTDKDPDVTNEADPHDEEIEMMIQEDELSLIMNQQPQPKEDIIQIEEYPSLLIEEEKKMSVPDLVLLFESMDAQTPSASTDQDDVLKNILAPSLTPLAPLPSITRKEPIDISNYKLNKIKSQPTTSKKIQMPFPPHLFTLNSKNIRNQHSSLIPKTPNLSQTVPSFAFETAEDLLNALKHYDKIPLPNSSDSLYGSMSGSESVYSMDNYSHSSTTRRKKHTQGDNSSVYTNNISNTEKKTRSKKKKISTYKSDDYEQSLMSMSASNNSSSIMNDEIADMFSLDKTTNNNNNINNNNNNQSQPNNLGDDLSTVSSDPILAMKGESFVKTHLLKQSLTSFKTLGYVDGKHLAYTNHWKKKIMSYLRSFESVEKLKKKLNILHSSCSVTFTTDEFICALAETHGSIGRVVDKARNNEFTSEIKLACHLCHIPSLVAMLVPNGMELYNKNIDYASGKYNISGGSFNSSIRSIQSSLDEDSLDGSTWNSSLDHHLSYSRDGSAVPSEAPPSLQSSPIKTGLLTIKGFEAQQKLPHLNLTSNTQTVQSLATTVPPVKRNVSPKLSFFKSTSFSSSFDGTQALSQFPSIGANNTQVQSSPSRESFTPLFPTNNNINGNNNRNNNNSKQSGSYDISAEEFTILGSGNTDDHSGRIDDFKLSSDESMTLATELSRQSKSVRLNNKISLLFDESQLIDGNPTLMLSRRDAVKATRDELLLRGGSDTTKRSIQRKLDRLIAKNNSNESN